MTDFIGQDALQRVLVKYQEKTFKKITTLHLLMVIKIMLKLEAGQFDIGTAFLSGKLEEDLWIASQKDMKDI
jgi:hypothetical protein